MPSKDHSDLHSQFPTSVQAAVASTPSVFHFSKGGVPAHDSNLKDHALLSEEFDTGSHDHKCFFALSENSDFPFLTVVQNSPPITFQMGALLIPSTELVFLGTGERLLSSPIQIKGCTVIGAP